MPAKRIKINFNGQEQEAEKVGINQSQENFNTYLLEDGSSLRLKTVVVDVVRMVDMFDPEGNPMYLIKSHNILMADAPEALKRKPE
jgi:hypothetical protein